MPNWCNNDLVVKGNRRDLIELKAEVTVGHTLGDMKPC